MDQLEHNTDRQMLPIWLGSLAKEYNVNEKSNTQYTSRRSTVKQPFINTKNGFIHKRHQPPLKALIKKFKTERLVKNFCTKLKRNLAFSVPTENQVEFRSDKLQFLKVLTDKPGIKISVFQQLMITMTSIAIMVILTIYYSLSMAFQQVQNYQWIKYVQVFSIIFYCSQTFLNFILKHEEHGKAYTLINEIAIKYIKSKFLLDFLSIIALTLDLIDNRNEWIKYMRFIIIIKFSQCFSKVQVLENIFITNFHREQYWGLINVVLINFSFAHILSILLNAMAQLNNTQNWLIAHNLQNSNWLQKYIWGYYWGTTIMLTVGFGDFVATTTDQAVWLIFIEMFSCITLAYNINCVGNLISNLRMRSIEKNQNLKIFNIMAKSNNISTNLEARINNYIEGTFLIKNDFNFSEQDRLLQFIPPQLKSEYLKETNISILQNLSTLKDLTQRTKSLLAERIVKIITHPQQIIQKHGEISKLMILKQGQVALTCLQHEDEESKSNKQKDKGVIQKLEVGQGAQAKLISLDFLKNKMVNYNIKALGYCVLYYLEKEDFIQIIKQSQLDFQHICMLRDREQYILDENQIHKCEYCENEYHIKVNCPKLHFIPLRQHVIHRFMLKKLNLKQQRLAVGRKRERLTRKDMCKLQQIIQTRFDLLTTMNQSTKNFTSPALSIHLSKEHDNVHQNLKQMYDNQNNNSNVEYWTVQSDQGYNWKFYFPNRNPNQLKNVSLKKKPMLSVYDSKLKMTKRISRNQ